MARGRGGRRGQHGPRRALLVRRRESTDRHAARQPRFHRPRQSGDRVAHEEVLPQQWDLDATGNWNNLAEDSDGDGDLDLDQDRTHNAANEVLTADTWATPDHDAAGNMTVVPDPYDLDSSLTCVYDAWNRLVKATKLVGATDETVAEYSYDGQNRRIVKKTYDEGELSETRHFYQGAQNQVLEERVGASTDAERQNVWGARDVKDLVLRDRDADLDPETGDLGRVDSGLEERLYALQDANWNVVAIADDVVERYTYTAYGKLEVRDVDFTLKIPSASDYGWTVLSTGRNLDTETGLYWDDTSYYDADLGRSIVRIQCRVCRISTPIVATIR